MNFKIKICGITSVVDATAAADAGADAIGLNFYRGSKRFVRREVAREIVQAVGSRADTIGVFVNEAADRIREVCLATGLHLVQLHGDEPPEFLRRLDKDREIIWARRFDECGINSIDDDLQSCRDLSGFCPAAILIDAAASGEFGGTGRTVDWQQLAGYRPRFGVPLILAGGLTPDNVAEAIRIVRPQAVDVASGVESAPGQKDAAKTRDFVAAAKAAFAAL